MLKFKTIQNNSNFNIYILKNNDNNNYFFFFKINIISRNLNNIFSLLQKKEELNINKINNQKNKNFFFCNINNLKIAYYQIKSNIRNLFFNTTKMILKNICLKLFFKINTLLLNSKYNLKIKYLTILNFKNKVIEIAICNYLKFFMLGI